jgi:EAL domain-containing protein (putative c-di-GMP-specific phosphodiesterase class I)
VSLDDGHVATYEATVLPGPTPGFADADTPEFELLLDALARAMTAWPLDVDASFNVSPERLVDRRFPDLVLTAADRYSLEPDRFVFEVNANDVTDDLHGAQQVLTRLREDGWRVGVDGVGATTPLLHTLALLPARFVKIDRTVVEDADPTMWDLLSIADAARSLGVTTVATGIRTLPELALAIAHEFDLAQGPLFSFQPPHASSPT